MPAVRGRRRLRLARWAVVVTAAGVLAGCSSPSGVEVPPGGDDLAPCPVRSLSAEELDSVGNPGCNLAGSVVTFDGGVSVEVSGVGAVQAAEPGSTPGRVYEVVNWGVPGVGAYEAFEDTLIKVWGTTPAARELQLRQAQVDSVDVTGYTEEPFGEDG